MKRSGMPNPRNYLRKRRATNLLFSPAERFKLNPESPVPLYHQLEQTILDRMATEGAIGKMLPPEFDLMNIFDVSRATVKKTTDDLAARGLIRRHRARGTEIISLGLREDLGRLTGYTEQMAQRGLKVSTVVLDVSEVEPPAAIRQRLVMERGDKALSVHRLRGTSKVFPVVLLHSYVPSHFRISRTEDFTGSLYQLIENKYRIPIAYADEEISASSARKEEAKHLQIATGSTVLVMERRTFTSLDRPLEYVRAVYRPEHYTFTIRLRR
jgi:GntR family transcriptional regulator